MSQSARGNFGSYCKNVKRYTHPNCVNTSVAAPEFTVSKRDVWNYRFKTFSYITLTGGLDCYGHRLDSFLQLHFTGAF